MKYRYYKSCITGDVRRVPVDGQTVERFDTWTEEWKPSMVLIQHLNESRCNDEITLSEAKQLTGDQTLC